MRCTVTGSDLIASVDILEFISQYTDFKKQGDEWFALSPFTNEKTPSFSVDTNKQVFYDFSSGKSGNLLDFIKQYNGCGTRQAFDILKQFAGLTDDEFNNPVRTTVSEIARRYANKQPKEYQPRGDYFLTNQNIMDTYEWNEDKLQLWVDEGISLDTMKFFGVKYDPVTDRIVYPIRNIDGIIENVGGRTLDPNYKDKGIRKYSYLYNWQNGVPLTCAFENLCYCEEKGEIIIFEGVKSVFLAHSFVVDNTACCLTSHLNQWQLKTLVRLGLNVVFAFDQGVNVYSDKNIKTLSRYCKVYYIDGSDVLDDKDSPVDKGKENFLMLLDRKVKY